MKKKERKVEREKGNILKRTLRWNFMDFLKATIGTLLFCLAINIFIVPNNLYNGGILGISQLLRSFIVNFLGVKIPFDISGLINFLINIPLIIIAYFKIGKIFVYRSIYCILLQTILLSLIPIPNSLVVDELITSVLIGGVIAGVGCGIILSSAASGGGTDIIGVLASMRNKNLSVGNVGLSFNIIVYGVSAIIYGYKTMIYSVLYSVFSSIMVDKMHDQNISSTVMIFTKEKPEKIVGFVKNILNRDATYWEARGAFKNEKTYVCYVVCSKYELQRLERNMYKLDDSSFLVSSDGVGIKGNFKKQLN